MPKITTLLTLAVLVLMGCDKISSDAYDSNMASAKKAFDQKDYASSIIELKSALQKNPESADARLLLGRAKLEDGNGADAEKELRLALVHGAAPETVAKYLYLSMSMQGKFEELLKEPIGVPVNTPPMDKALFYAYRGQAWFALGNFENANREYSIGAISDPNSPPIKLGLAELALKRNDVNLAVSILKEGLQANPQEATLWDLLGDAQRHLKKFAEAETSFSNAIAFSKSNLLSLASRALTRLEQGKLNEAHQDLDLLIRKAPTHYATHFLSGAVYFYEKNYANAKSELEQCLRINEHYAQAYYLLGLTNLELNNYPQAEEAIAKFRNAFPDSAQAIKLLAYSKFRNHDYKNSRLLIQIIFRKDPTDEFALNLLGNIELNSGNHEKALEYFQKLTDIKPESSSPKYQLSRAYFSVNEFSKGIEVLEQIKETGPANDIALATAELRANNLKKAKELVLPLFKSLSNTPIPYNLLGLINLKEGRSAEAVAVFQEGLAKHEGDPTLSHNLSQILIKERRLDEARKICETSLQSHPQHLGMNLDLAFIDALEGNNKAMEIRLTEMIAEHPEAIEPKGILARHYIQTGQPHRAMTLLEKALEVAPDNPLLLESSTQALLGAKLYSKALDSALKLTFVSPNSKDALFLLAKSYQYMGDTDKMEKALDRVLALDPKSLAARILKVRLLTMRNQMAEAEKMQNTLAKDYPNNPTIADLKGWIAMRNNQPKLAVDVYKSLLEKTPNRETLINLVNAELAANNTSKALEWLEKWLAKHPKDGMTLYFRSGILASLGQFEDARKDMETALSITPDNVLVLNDLAWLIRNSDHGKAIEYAEKAASIAPFDTNVKDTLATVYLDSGQVDKAILILQTLAESYPKDPSIAFHLALALEKSGNKQEAVELLRKAVASELNFPERKSARDLLSALTK